MTPNPPRRTPHQVSSNKTPRCTRLPGRICSVVSTWPTAISRTQIELERASDGALTDIEVKLRGRSGRVIPVSMSCVLVRDRQGKVTGVLAMARDITARLLDGV
jgi:PAS domain S-box-containing protein